MKKLLILLLVLLGSMPLETWRSGTPEQQTAFMQKLADAYGEATYCKRGTLFVFSDKEDTYFHFDCEEKKEEKKVEEKL